MRVPFVHIAAFGFGVSASACWAMGDAGKGPLTVQLECEGGVAAQNCAAFVELMQSAHPRYQYTDSDADLVIVLTMVQRSERSLSGQIVWQGTKTGQGPELISGISDATINDQQIGHLIETLIRASDLPL